MKNILNLFSMIILLISIIFVSGCASQESPLTANSKETLTYSTPVCTPEWKCSNWSKCRVSDWECNPKCEFPKIQTRTCIDNNDCGVTIDKPLESQSCTLPVIDHLNVNPCIGTPINIWSKPDSAMRGSAKVGSIPDCQNIQVEVLDRKCSSVSVEFDLIRYEGLEGWVTRRTLVCPAKYNESGCWYASDSICNEKGDCPTGTVKIDDKYGVCGECKNNDNCPIDKPICFNNECVECIHNSDCTANKSLYERTCFNNNCVKCGRYPVCPSDKPICVGWRDSDNPDFFTCVECKNDSDCTNPEEPFCYKNCCEECLVNSDCEDSEKPYCGDAHSCIECVIDADCRNPEKPRCNSRWEKCAECASDSDCKSPNKPYCDDFWGVCGECKDLDYSYYGIGCDIGYHCSRGTCSKDY